MGLSLALALSSCDRVRAPSPVPTPAPPLVAEVQRPDPDRIVWKASAATRPSAMPLKASATRPRDPMDGISGDVEAKLRAWAKDGLPAFTLREPVRPSPPPLPTLAKGEFETSTAFRERVAVAERDRAEAIRALERVHQRQVREYDEAVAEHNRLLKAEMERRRSELPAMRARFLSEAVAERLGDPEIRDLRYDADTQTFFGLLSSSDGRFERPIAVPVPLAKAPGFRASAAPAVEFRIDGPRLLLSRISVAAGGSVFEAMPMDAKSAPAATVATLRDVPLSVPDLPKAKPGSADVDALLGENRRLFASIAGSDPALDDLRRREEEVAKRMREAERRQAVEAERERLLASIRRQEEELERIGGDGPAAARQWSFRPAARPATDTVAVVIGNRSYGPGVPKVRFAANDARAVRQFLETGLRVPPENVVFELDATKGTMEGIFLSRLPNMVERGRTSVVVYYSGHGFPVGDDARLMPADSRPDTAKVTGYSRRELLEQLAGLGARDVTVILDACFTGLSADGPLLASAKPVMVRPVSGAAAAPGMVVISASQADEVSWTDDESGMSLLTLHLLEGLSAPSVRSVDVAGVAAHLASTVDRHARRIRNLPQRPQVAGENRVLVEYGGER